MSKLLNTHFKTLKQLSEMRTTAGVELTHALKAVKNAEYQLHAARERFSRAADSKVQLDILCSEAAHNECLQLYPSFWSKPKPSVADIVWC